MIHGRRRDPGKVDMAAPGDFDRGRIGHPHIRRVGPVDVFDRFAHFRLRSGLFRGVWNL